MSKRNDRDRLRPSTGEGLEARSRRSTELGPDEERVLELREEELVAHKELRNLGQVVVRTEVDEVPAKLEVDALREEVEVRHEPVGEVVSERGEPWEEDGEMVFPIYEEQLVVTKRLVLRERLRVRRIATTQRQTFEEMVRRERLVIDDPQRTGLVHEVYPKEEDRSPTEEKKNGTPEREGGVLENLVRKALE
jgi:uncharacterized protein (TIGR02271 family)